MRVPFLSFTGMHLPLRQAMLDKFEQFFDSNWFVLGQQVKDFEMEYAKYNGVEHTVGVANGLEALHIALMALEIGEGDEVIVPSNTYIATWLAISFVGAKVVPVEPRLDTYNLDPKRLEEKITPRTKCIMPVHLYGQACEMDAIMAIANKHGIKVVEDNAQSQGALCNGRKTGSFGHLNGTSFYPGKNFGALGDAGAITTNDAALAKTCFTIRNYGSQKKYYNERIGVNSRLDECHAGFLSVKMPYLEGWNQARRAIAQNYYKALNGVGDLVLPVLAEGVDSVYHQFVVRTKHRDQLQAFLKTQEIGTLIHYPVPPHLQEAYSHLGYKKGDYPIAEEIAETILSLPIYPGLTESQQDYVVAKIAEYFASL